MKSRLLYCLALGLFLSAPLHASISLVGTPQIASDSATTGNTTFSGVTVLAGDYVVVATSSNKNFAQNQLTFSWSGTEGSSGVSTSLSTEQNFASYLSYTSVIVGGTYDFNMLAANSTLTANSALYVLRPGAGETITVANTASQAGASASAASLSYLFASSLSSAIAIEAATTRFGGAFTLDSNYLTPNSTAAASGRLLSYSTAVTGSSWSSSDAFTTTPSDIASIGGVFTTTASPAPEPARTLLIAAGVAAMFYHRRRS